ncbi:MAG: putative DNA binding domain-containing protein [Bacteroidales bacterium]|nr:putative DNA binding domain-containing protein [Bacteroidales bacterium]
MTINDIETLIHTDETRNLELKKTTGELKDGMKSACAFLNTDGGWLIFGIAPTTLKVVGQDVTENTRREIAQALTHLEPALDVEVNYVDLPNSNGKQVIVMHFDKWVWGKEPYTYHKCPYYRIESVTKEMPRDMFVERLKAARPHDFAWENQTAERVTLDDMDEERIRNAVRLGIAGGRINASAEGATVETLLGKLKLLNNGKPTNAAVMLFGKNTDDYPQLLLRMACFKGNDKNEFLDNKQEMGNFFDLLDAGTAFCFRNLRLAGKIVGMRREEQLEIPAEALREALINALCHREYDNPRASVSLAIYYDRIEIVNPGHFPAQLTPENIKLQHDSFPFNLKIAQVLYQTTYLESWGSGVRRMVKLCEAQHLAEPEYRLGNNTVTVIFRRNRDSQNDSQNDSQKSLNERQRKIVGLMRGNRQITVAKIAKTLSLSAATIYREIKAINTLTELYWEGSPKTGQWAGNTFD